jgi:N-acetylglutamate synthase-like GNAT family acetyltransferase
VEIDWDNGPRSALRASFRLAESSEETLDSYIGLGRVLVARRDAGVVGHLQLVATDDERIVEIKNMAVAGSEQGTGIGRTLVERAVATARREGAVRVVVATGAADVANLRFYQRCGFRMVSIEPDAFTPETGYPVPIVIDGIELRDRVWFSREL